MDSPTADLSHPMMRRLFEYWRTKCSGDRLPGRHDIDPLDIPDLLPYVTMFDVVRAGDRHRFRFRLIGTANVQLMGNDCTGKFLDEVLPPEDATRVATNYSRVMEERRPHHWRAHLVTPGREHIHFERLMVPLAADGRTVDMLLALYLPAESGA